jgi:hypothetical protein
MLRDAAEGDRHFDAATRALEAVFLRGLFGER